MKEKDTVRYTLETLPNSQTDWARVDAMTDADIERAIAEDADAAPVLVEADWKNARLVKPENKVLVSLPLDADLVDWFQAQGSGYPVMINAILRHYIEAQRAHR